MIISRIFTKQEQENKRKNIKNSFTKGTILYLNEGIECFISNDEQLFTDFGYIKGSIIILKKLEAKIVENLSLLKILHEDKILYITLFDYGDYDQL